MLKVIISFLIVSVFIGCSSTKQTSVTYEKYKTNKEIKALHVEDKKVTKGMKLPYVEEKKNTKENNLVMSGTIKGYISNLKHINNIWHYRVEGIDFSNHKLPLAEFTHTDRLAKKGDLVYVIIKDGKLKELFLIKKGNYKKKKIEKRYKKNKRYKKIEVKTHKRTKKRQLLGIPTSEEISLD